MIPTKELLAARPEDATNGFLAAKPGYKTTEFWMSLAATVASSFAASGVFADGSHEAQIAGVISTAIIPIIYSFLRAQTKK